MLFNTKIVGLHYYVKEDKEKVVDRAIGGLICLKREKDNTYDKNAIFATYKDIKLGYIAKEKAELLAQIMDNGGIKKLFGKIQVVEKSPYRLKILTGDNKMEVLNG